MDSKRNRAQSIAADSLVSTDGASNLTSAYEDELPNFEIEPVQLQFELQNSLQILRVQNNKMFLVTDTSVFKIDLDNPLEVHLYALPTPLESNRVSNCWLHPNGLHLLIQLNYKHHYYLHDSYTKFKVLSKLKNIDVSAVVFSNLSPSDDSTGDFLVATNDSIYVCYIKVHDPFTQENKRDDKYFKQVYKLPGQFCGLAVLSYQISLLCKGKLYTWDCYDQTYAELVKVFKTTPRVTSVTSSANWLVDSTDGTYTYIDSSTKETISNDSEFQLSPDEKLSTSYVLSKELEALVATKHYFLVLDESHTKIILVNKLANTSSVLSVEKAVGLVADKTASTYWLYTSNNIFEITAANESASLWHTYYKMGKYDMALRCLDEEPGNTFKKDMVMIKQGYDFLQRGGFGAESNEEAETALELQIKGIETLSNTSEPFEKICLMLLNVQTLSAEPRTKSNYTPDVLLIKYIAAKYAIAKKQMEKIRMIVLSSWMVEIWLRVLYQLDLDIQKKDNSSKKKLHSSLDSELNSFLSANHKHIDVKTLYQIMHEFHFPAKMISLMEMMEDYENLLNYYIGMENWPEAIQALVKVYTKGTPESKELIYKCSTVLLVNSAKETTRAWFKFEDVDHERFLPAILTYNKNNGSIPVNDNCTLSYLQKIIIEKGIKSSTVVNYLLSLLITYPSADKSITKRIIKILNYVQGETKKGLYDANFILRLCLQYKHYEPAILILINDICLFGQALTLALDNDLTELAEFVLKKHDEYIFNENSSNFHEDYELVYNNTEKEEDISFVGKIKLEEESFSARKKLWLMFAKYLIEGVCQGKNYKVLDIVEGIDFIDSTPAQLDNAVKDLTNNLLGSMTGGENDNEIVNEVDLKRLNRVLKYLLNSSYSNNRGSNVLTLKDLLPLFPESIMINNFKDEIVLSLNQYNNRINQLNLEMQESSKVAHQLKEKIKEAASNEHKGKIHTIIEPGESCRLCMKLLVSKNFICFPSCHHAFHKECVVRHYLKLKGDYQFKKVFQAFKKNASAANKKELDQIMLKECVLCNESNINNIDANLVDLVLEKDDAAKWAL